jgi:hypothetical protein
MALSISHRYKLSEQQIIENRLLEKTGNLSTEKTRALADKIHANWQEGARESGLAERWKDIKELQGDELSCYLKDYSAYTRKPEGGIFHQVNILALSNRELPLEHQTENLRSAAHAVGASNAFLSFYDPVSIRKNLENIDEVFKTLPQEALSKDCKDGGWICGFMDKDEQDFIKDEFNAIALVASKIHDAWIERASSWLDASSNQANHFFSLNNYNQRADLAILKSFCEL